MRYGSTLLVIKLLVIPEDAVFVEGNAPWRGQVGRNPWSFPDSCVQREQAAMGAGNFLGPAIGMAALLCAPGNPHTGAYAMSGLLGVGLLGLLRLRFLPVATRSPNLEKT